MADTLEVLSACINFIKKDTERIQVDIEKLDEKMEKTYLTIKQFKSEFEPIRNVIYAMIGTILLAVLGALVTFIIKGGLQ
jgi:peptidoglycan hydrolase CwlO-like protein